MNRIVVLLFFLAPLSATAQFSKGSWVPGLSVGTAFFNSGTVEYTVPPPTAGYTSSTNSLGFSLTPSMGYFVSSKTMIGGRLVAGFTYDKYIDDANNVTFRKKEDRSSQWGLGLFARQYLGESSRYLPFAQIQIDGGISPAKVEGFNYTSTYRESYTGKGKGNMFFNAGLQLGLTRMLNENLGLDFSAGYLFSHKKTRTVTNTDRDINFDGSIDEMIQSDLTANSNNHGFSLQVGIWVLLGKK